MMFLVKKKKKKLYDAFNEEIVIKNKIFIEI